MAIHTNIIQLSEAKATREEKSDLVGGGRPFTAIDLDRQKLNEISENPHCVNIRLSWGILNRGEEELVSHWRDQQPESIIEMLDDCEKSFAESAQYFHGIIEGFTTATARVQILKERVLELPEGAA